MEKLPPTPAEKEILKILFECVTMKLCEINPPSCIVRLMPDDALPIYGLAANVIGELIAAI